MAREHWTAAEVDKTVDTYFSMLTLELEGESFSKAAFRRELRQQIDRSDGSLEYKMQNISAVLDDLGAMFIDGYKPARNVQALLRDAVTERFTASSALRQQMLRAADLAVPDIEVQLGDPVEVPVVARDKSARQRIRTGRIIDFQLREASNRALGRAGELTVVRGERRRLERLGRQDLAERVRHVSELDGDGLGYDVFSFTAEGEERFIEVKTTKYSREIPFFVSRNEVDFSTEEPERFRLYRLFGFGLEKGGHYQLSGSLTDSTNLIPEVFRALPA